MSDHPRRARRGGPRRTRSTPRPRPAGPVAAAWLPPTGPWTSWSGHCAPRQWHTNRESAIGLAFQTSVWLVFTMACRRSGVRIPLAPPQVRGRLRSSEPAFFMPVQQQSTAALPRSPPIPDPPNPAWVPSTARPGGPSAQACCLGPAAVPRLAGNGPCRRPMPRVAAGRQTGVPVPLGEAVAERIGFAKAEPELVIVDSIALRR